MSTSWVIAAERTSLACGPVGQLGLDFQTMTFTWADLDGLPCARAPDAAPGATHLWGWDGASALLARLECSHIVAGTVLRRGATGVPVTVRPLLPWRLGDPTVRGLPSGLVRDDLVTLEALGPLELLADRRWTRP